MYRIYAQLDDTRGYHTAVFYDQEMASKYFKNIRAKYPDGYIKVSWNCNIRVSRLCRGSTDFISVTEKGYSVADLYLR